jgi:hypothetical protein
LAASQEVQVLEGQGQEVLPALMASQEELVVLLALAASQEELVVLLALAASQEERVALLALEAWQAYPEVQAVLLALAA